MGEANRRRVYEQTRPRARIFESLFDAVRNLRITASVDSTSGLPPIVTELLGDFIKIATVLDAGRVPRELVDAAQGPNFSIHVAEEWVAAGTPLPSEVMTLICYEQELEVAGVPRGTTMRVAMLFSSQFDSDADDAQRTGLFICMLMSMDHRPWEVQPVAIRITPDGHIKIYDDSGARSGDTIKGPVRRRSGFQSLLGASLNLTCNILLQVAERPRIERQATGTHELLQRTASTEGGAHGAGEASTEGDGPYQDVRVIDVSKPVVQFTRDEDGNRSFAVTPTGATKSPHNRIGHMRFLRRSQRWVAVRESKIHGGQDNRPIVVTGLRGAPQQPLT